MKSKNVVEVVMSYNKVKKTIKHIKPGRYFDTKKHGEEVSFFLVALLYYLLEMCCVLKVKKNDLEESFNVAVSKVYENKK